MQNQPEKLRALLETTKAITSELDLNKVLNLILQRGKELTNADTRALLLVDKDQKLWTKKLIGPHKEEEDRYTIDEGITGWVARNKEPLLVPDVSSDERYIEWTPETKSELAVPMLYGKKLIGVLNVESFQLGAFEKSDCELLTALAGHAAIAIENARLYEELHKQVKIVDSLNKVGAEITANIEQIPIMREIAKGLNEIVEADIPLVYLYNQEKDEFTNIYYGDVSEEWTKCVPRKKGAGVKAIKEKRIIDVHEDDEKPPGISTFAKKKGVKTTIAIPLFFGDNDRGAMYLHFLGEQHRLKNEYLFSWDKVPGRDTERLQRFLRDAFDIGWAENARISKSDGGKSIRISKDENSVEIMIDEKKEKATLKINDAKTRYLKTRYLKVKKENGELNIYEDEEEGIRQIAKQTSASIKNTMEEIGFYPESNKKRAELKEKNIEKMDREKIVEQIGELTKADILLMYLCEREENKYEYLFSIDEKLADDLNKSITGKLKDIFETKGIALSDNPLVTKKRENEWEITDEENFIVRKEVGKLNIHKEKLMYILFAGLSKEWGVNCKPREDGAGKTAIKEKGLVTAYENPKESYPIEGLDINPYPKQKGAKTTAAYPLIFDDKTFGVFFMHFLERHEFTGDDKRAIHALGTHAAIALERAKTYRDFRYIVNFGKEVTTDISLKAVAKIIAKAIERIIGGGIPNIFLYDFENENLNFIACSGAQEELFLGSIIPRKKVGLGARVIEKVKKGEKPDYIIVEDVQNDPKNENPSPSAKAHDIKTSACFPLKFGYKPLGALYLHFKNKRKFSSDDILMLKLLTDQMAIAINNATQYETQMAIQREIQERLTPTGTINTDLKIMLAGRNALGDLAYGLCSEEELRELFQRLFTNVDEIIIAPLQPGLSGARVVKVQPVGLPNVVVVKFGEREKVEEEAKRFDNEVSGKIGGASRITHKMKQSSTPSIGGIEYTFIGTAVDKVRSFNKYYNSQKDVEKINKTIEGLFSEVFGFWFIKKTERGFDLADWYRNHLQISLQTLENEIFTGTLTEYRDRNLINIDNCGNFPNPVRYVMNEENFIFSTFSCSIHGDLNGNNMLVDPSGYVWLIDFAKTGQGYVFHDFIKLECVIKFELLKTVDVKALYEFEEALLLPEMFSDFATMSFSNSYNKDDLKKGFAVIKKLRELAWDVIRPLDKSNREYYVGLLYQTLSTLRRTDIRREHAFLSASMISGALD